MFPLQVTTVARRAPLATWAIIAVNLFIFLLELTLTPEQLQEFFYLFGLVPARYTHPQWAQWVGLPLDDFWPFFTSMFLHGGWMHIIGNMWTLWLFGESVEDRLGTFRFVVFYLLCGICAAVVHYMTNPHSQVPTVGASGAIAGVLGAYYVLFPRARVIVMVPILFWPFFFDLPAVTYLAFWFFLQLFNGTLSLATAGTVGGVAWWAHAGGFVAGMILLAVFLPPRRKQPHIDPAEYAFPTAWKRLW